MLAAPLAATELSPLILVDGARPFWLEAFRTRGCKPAIYFNSFVRLRGKTKVGAGRVINLICVVCLSVCLASVAAVVFFRCALVFLAFLVDSACPTFHGFACMLSFVVAFAAAADL